MKVKVMVKVKAKTGKEAKEIVVRIMNMATREDELSDKPLIQSWGWPKEFKK
jgi:hypothetical protein